MPTFSLSDVVTCHEDLTITCTWGIGKPGNTISAGTTGTIVSLHGDGKATVEFFTEQGKELALEIISLDQLHPVS